MSGSLKLGLIIIGGVLAVGIALRLLSGILSWITPVAIVVGVGFVLYGLFSKGALGGGRRYLP